MRDRAQMSARRGDTFVRSLLTKMLPALVGRCSQMLEYVLESIWRRSFRGRLENWVL